MGMGMQVAVRLCFYPLSLKVTFHPGSLDKQSVVESTILFCTRDDSLRAALRISLRRYI